MTLFPHRSRTSPWADPPLQRLFKLNVTSCCPGGARVRDRKGVAKPTRTKIQGEVKSFPALVVIGELAKKSPNLEVRSIITGGDGKSHGAILMKVFDQDGEELLVKSLATDAMKNWMVIIRKYRI